MSDHRTVVHEALCASDAVRMQATRIYNGHADARLGAVAFRYKMAERGLSFPDPVADAKRKAELDTLVAEAQAMGAYDVPDVACLSQPCALEPGWDVAN